MQSLGTILAVRPEGDMLPENVSTVHAVLASFQPPESSPGKFKFLRLRDTPPSKIMAKREYTSAESDTGRT